MKQASVGENHVSNSFLLLKISPSLLTRKTRLWDDKKSCLLHNWKRKEIAQITKLDMKILIVIIGLEQRDSLTVDDIKTELNICMM